MFGLNYLSMGVGGALSAVVVFGGLSAYNALIENPQVRKEQTQLIEAQARQRAMDLIQERNEDNAEISNLDVIALCAELGGRWVSNENRCD